MHFEYLYKILCDIKHIVLDLGQLSWIDYVQLFISILSGLMDAILFVIAIYTFYLTFVSNKISIITFGESFGMWESDKINFIIKNHSLKNQTIKSVHAVFDNKYRLEIRKYDLPFVLEPLRTMKVEMEPYTYMDKFTLSSLCSEYTSPIKIHLEITTDEQKKIYAKFKRIKKYNINKKANLEDIFISQKSVNGIVVKDDYKYVLYYKFGDEGQMQTAFINDFGFISTDVFGFNHIPAEYLQDEEKVSNCFMESCKRNNIQLVLYDIKKRMSFK